MRPLTLERRVWITLICIFVIQVTIFCGTRLFVDPDNLHIVMTPIDEAVPFVPAWVVMYCLAFPSWLINEILIFREKEASHWFTSSYVTALLISAVIFIAFPCTLERPEVTGTGLFPFWVRIVYKVDPPMSLFPSLHVMISYFCFRGTLKCRNLPKWVAPFNFVFWIFVSLSILFVKQHVFVDIPSAVIVAEVAILIARLLHLERIPEAIENKFSKKTTQGGSAL